MKINFLPFWVSVLHLTTNAMHWVERYEHTVFTTQNVQCEHFCEIKRFNELFLLLFRPI